MAAGIGGSGVVGSAVVFGAIAETRPSGDSAPYEAATLVGPVDDGPACVCALLQSAPAKIVPKARIIRTPTGQRVQLRGFDMKDCLAPEIESLGRRYF